MPTLRKPRPLHPGATIAVVAPSSAPRDAGRLDEGVRHLRALGYRVDVRPRGYAGHGYLSDADDARLAELNDALRRDDIDALFCVRGGYGALRLLPHVDYEAARRHPKLVVGYSDVTALHLALLARSGVPGLSGPMVAVEWGAIDAATERHFWALARGAAPDVLLGPAGERLVPARPGTAEGVLVGGNLSLVARLVGTPYLPPLDGAILFLEEVGEMPYRVDALLAQLDLAGHLDRLGGLVLGAFTEWEPPDDRPTLMLDDVFDHYTRDRRYPVARGLVYGHFPTKSTLPIGVRARLHVDADGAVLTLLEPVVADATAEETPPAAS